MYIHLGSDVVAEEKDIIGFFDMDTTTVAKATRDFLVSEQNTGALITVAEDIPRSFVVCRDKTYLSQLNTSTLGRRSANGMESLE